MKQCGRFLALAVVLAIALSLFAGCERGRDENETAMLEQWHSYLEVNEQVWSTMFWAYDYAETFCRDNNWDSLLKARAAASAALLGIRTTGAPECTLTQEQCDDLLKRNIEVDVVLTEYESLNTTLQFREDTMNLLATHLNNDVYLDANMEVVRDWLVSSQKYTRLEMEYLWLTTNYLLIQLRGGELWQQWQEEFPVMASVAPDWQDDPDAVMAAADTLLNTMAEELTRFSGYLGGSEYAYQIVKDAVDTGDLTTLAREINALSGVPGYIPCPAWMPEVVPVYVNLDAETEEPMLISAGEELDQLPSACYISCAGISLENVESYADNLTLWGLEPWCDWDEASQMYQILVSSEDANMMLQWTEAETVLYLYDSVGCLMPELYLAAMLAE